MAEKRDYYEVLGIPKGASSEEIKKAYRKLAQKISPGLTTPATKRPRRSSRRSTRPYEVLSDPEKKARYDQFGHAGVDPSYGAGRRWPAAFGGGFGGWWTLGDIFGAIFGGGFGFGGLPAAPTPTPRRKGGDVRRRLVNLTFMEAVHGCKKTITLNPEGSAARSAAAPARPRAPARRSARTAAAGAW